MTHIKQKFENIYKKFLHTAYPNSTKLINSTNFSKNDDVLFDQFLNIMSKNNEDLVIKSSIISSIFSGFSLFLFYNKDISINIITIILSFFTMYYSFNYIKNFFITKKLNNNDYNLNFNKLTIFNFLKFFVSNLDISKEEQLKIYNHCKIALTMTEYSNCTLFQASANDKNYYDTNKVLNINSRRTVYDIYILMNTLLDKYDKGIIYVPDQTLEENHKKQLIDNFSLDKNTASNYDLWSKLISLKNNFESLQNNEDLKNIINNNDINFINNNFNKLIDYEKSFINSNDIEMKNSIKNLIKTNIEELINMVQINIDSLNQHLIKEIKINNKTLKNINK